MAKQRTPEPATPAPPTMSETPTPNTGAKGPKFKSGEKAVKHPVLGVITELELEHPTILAAIDKLDKRGDTKEWRKQFLTA